MSLKNKAHSKKTPFLTLIGSLLMTILSPSYAADTSAESIEKSVIPDKKLYVAIEEKQSPEEQIKALYLSVKHLADSVSSSDLCQFPYIDGNNHSYTKISAFPFIVMKGNKTKIGDFANSQFSDVTLKTDGTNPVRAVAAFGETSQLLPVTKRFQIYRPKTSLIPSYVPIETDFNEDTLEDIILLSEQLDYGSQLNAFAHMVVGSGDYPSMQMTYGTMAEDSLSKLWDTCKTQKVNHITFLETMHLGPTYKEQIKATKHLQTPRITGLYMNGKKGILNTLLRALR